MFQPLDSREQAPPAQSARIADAPTSRDSQGKGTIRGRLARILAIPAVVILALLAVVANEEVGNYRDSVVTSRTVTLALAVQDLVHELQTERGLAAGVLGGNVGFQPELRPARARVDAQRAALLSLAAGEQPVPVAVRRALSQLDGVQAIREAVDSGSAERAGMFDYFTARIAALGAVEFGLDDVGDPRLRRGVDSLQALSDASEALAQERAILNGVFSAGGFARGEFVQFAAMRAAKQAALERFSRTATPAARASADYVFDTGPARVTAHFEQVAIDAADGRHIVVNPQSWWSALTTVLDDTRQLQEHVGSQIQVRAHQLQTEATLRLAALGAGVLLCLLGSIYLAVLASASVTRPLAALATEAESVAATRLPAAVRRLQDGAGDTAPAPPPPVTVPARATGEIQSVATALDHLQSAAYRLATEQVVQRRSTIEALANLGRRNQNLIRRQLGFITSLEREEIDPSALANLFELDHLATRMRRNAASLLVLVGASSPRQWTTPVPMADVIRAAVSEVEEYRRVSLRRVDDALVLGNVVGAVAHLLSELIENGLMFSPPDCEVEVQGRVTADGYLVAVIDQGVGMSPDDLRQANARLRGEGDFIATPTRFLGHFVVGRLAQEASLGVELLPSPVTGITARVTIPPHLIVTPHAVESHVIIDLDTPRHAAEASKRAQLTAHPEPPPPVPPPPVPTSPVPTSPVPVAPGLAVPTRAAPDRVSSSPSAPSTARVAARLPEPERYIDVDVRDVERTRNGLRKRPPRTHRSGPATRPSPAPGGNSSERPDLVDGSPTELRARLTALRAGIARGQSSATGSPITRPDSTPE